MNGVGENALKSYDKSVFHLSEMHPRYPLSLGAILLPDNRCRFRVWAPKARKVEVLLNGNAQKNLPMEPRKWGYFQTTVEGVKPGERYLFRLDGQKEFPDPASRFQPEGVHKPSQVVDPTFDWEDDGWAGLPLKDYIIYELHVGTFTPEGTFDAAIPYLDELKELGVTAVELMPVAQFPGTRNWGYDGAYPFAVQNSYGGPDGLRRLVNACHLRGLAVIMDVVYNHLGPEGNYLAEFGHYFTYRYQTPWGPALNYDGHYSDEVRRYFIENALYWVNEFHIDSLRLDAVHAIFDQSARPFLQELADAVHEQGAQLNRQVFAIAESSLNATRLIRPKEMGGYEMDAQWNDDFHHSLHTHLTNENTGYYADFSGLDDLEKAYQNGYVLTGQYSIFRGRRHGVSSHEISPVHFVVCAQNHDQVGNRMLGERLTQLVSFDELKLTAGTVLISPYIPLIFMGEEYGETAPFQYFVSHNDPELVEAVRKGRAEEFAAFHWEEEPPDPQSEDTYQLCKLNHQLKQEGTHKTLLAFYKTLIHFRKHIPALAFPSKDHMHVHLLDQAPVLIVRRWTYHDEVVSLFHFGEEAVQVTLPRTSGRWTKLLDSAEEQWKGPGSFLPNEVQSMESMDLNVPPRSLVVYANEGHL